MKIATEIGSFLHVGGYERAVELVGMAGFDAFDLSLFHMARYDRSSASMRESDDPFHGCDYLKRARELKRVGEACGIVCNQSHAPFPCPVPGMRDYLRRALECTAEAGGTLCVIHPDGNSEEEMLEMYAELLPFARGCGVRIAAENIAYWNKEKGEYMPHFCSEPQGFVKQLDTIDDPYFVACLDVAHAELKGLDTSAVSMIRALGGKRLQALHIHDNNHCRDQHKLPFTGEIDFSAVVGALKEIGYTGYFTMEADAFMENVSPERVKARLCEMAAVARRLADMFENA